MKVSGYQTNDRHFMAKKRIFANAQKNDWISTVKVDENVVCDSFDGFGVALTGSSCYELYEMPKEQREQFLEDIYGKDGLDLSVARLSIGSSDYSTSVYSYCDTPNDRELKNFTIKKDREFIIPMIKEVTEHNPNMKFLASPWSPPGWMKTGGFLAHGYMRDEYIDCYADYFVKYIRAYEKEGIRINAVTPQNEPEAHHNGTSVACIWSPDTEGKFILRLKQKFDENNIDTKIWMYDHCFIGWPRIVWTLKEYPELLKCVDSVALHYYEGGVELVDNIKAEFPNMKWNFTEGGPRLYDNYGTDWVKWSLVMARTLAYGGNSFFGWNLLLDDDGGPNVGPFGCGGLATRDRQTGELSYSGQYHAFKHFSKFIKRGAKIRKAKLTEDFSGAFGYPHTMKTPIDAVCADNTDGSRVLVIVNSTDVKRQAQYYCGGQWWYTELMPNSVLTLCFENE